MNAASSAAGLPESVRLLIETQPSIRARVENGMELGRILSCPDWAAEWAANADTGLKFLLEWLIRRYAGIPFEEQKIEREVQLDGRFTGAEIRVGLAVLRRSGILFAIRKTWGDRLYYVPTDMVPVWRRLLFPGPTEALTDQEAGDAQPSASAFRLPLSHEMLSAWAFIRRDGLPFTAKGAIAKPPAVRMAAAMRITADEIAPLALTDAQADQLPPQTALALDLGLAAGVLEKRQHGIFLSAGGLSAWLSRSAPEAETELHRLAVERYAAAEARRHLAACAIAACSPLRWFRLASVVRGGVDAEALNTWLAVLVSFGWAERGTSPGEDLLRILFPFDLSRPAADGGYLDEPFYVQPDGDILVPPDVMPSARWTLEEIADRITADRVFVYRLSRRSVSRAVDAGYDERRLVDFLEKGSDCPLPVPVRETLTDWLARIGKVRLADVTLLRTDSEETALRLLNDPETAALLGERIGSRDFLVDRDRLKAVVDRLERLGYPPMQESKSPLLPLSGSNAAGEGAETGGRRQTGSTFARQVPSMLEPDRTIPLADELFPGLADIPPVWLRQPGSYHHSTRRELIRKAINWRTEVRIEGGERSALFVPQSLDDRGENWTVRGRWKTPSALPDTAAGDNRQDGVVTLGPDRFETLMIVLPAWEINLISR